MISAGSYKLFELEILHRILCKSLVKKRSLISCVHPSILGAGDAVSEVTTSIRTASLFLKVVFFFSASCFPSEPELEREQSLCCWQIVSTLFPPYPLVTTSSLQRGTNVSGYFPLHWGVVVKRALLFPVIVSEAEAMRCMGVLVQPSFFPCNYVSSEMEKCDIVKELGCTCRLGSDEIRGSASCLPKYLYDQESQVPCASWSIL